MNTNTDAPASPAKDASGSADTVHALEDGPAPVIPVEQLAPDPYVNDPRAPSALRSYRRRPTRSGDATRPLHAGDPDFRQPDNRIAALELHIADTIDQVLQVSKVPPYGVVGKDVDALVLRLDTLLANVQRIDLVSWGKGASSPHVARMPGLATPSPLPSYKAP